MSYVIKYLTNLTELKSELTLHPERIRYYSKYSCFVGDTDAVQYIQSLIKN